MEQQILRQNVHKAPGLDRVNGDMLRQVMYNHPLSLFTLLFKKWSTGAEPLQYKGGPIHCIAKKAGGSKAKDMRGIMLLDVIGKCYHGLVSARFMKWSGPKRLPTQFGGYSKQQTLFATQMLRSSARATQRAQISTITIVNSLFLFESQGVFQEQ